MLATVSDYIWSSKINPMVLLPLQFAIGGTDSGRPAVFTRPGAMAEALCFTPENGSRRCGADRMGLLTASRPPRIKSIGICATCLTVWVRNSVTASQSPDGLRCLNGIIIDYRAPPAGGQGNTAAPHGGTAPSARCGVGLSIAVNSDSGCGQFILPLLFASGGAELLGRPPLVFLAGGKHQLSAPSTPEENRPGLVQTFAPVANGTWAFAEEGPRIVLQGDAEFRIIQTALLCHNGGRRSLNGVVSDITARAVGGRCCGQKPSSKFSGLAITEHSECS